jgi:glycerate kinase
MRILIAMDSYKGNLSSLKVAGIVERGIRRVYADAIVDKVAVADGGEGTSKALTEYLRGKYVQVEATGPLGDQVRVHYGIVHGDTAIMEMAEASGLSLIPEDKRDSLRATTYGTGEMIVDAMGRGCRKIVLGIGGSATNDGGAGMAAALGVRLLDEDGNDIGPGGRALGRLARVDMSGIDPRVADTECIVACDVDNPLCGEKGASRVFGPQKGAAPEMVSVLDRNLSHFAQIIRRDLSMDVADIPGAGAAGGLGAGLIAFCGARLQKGIDVVLDAVDIEARIKDADIVITGEGRVDGQTAHGKVPVGVAARAKKYGKPVFAIAGFIGEGAEAVYDHGIDAVMSSMVGPMSLEEAIRRSPELIERAAERLFRIIRAVSHC